MEEKDKGVVILGNGKIAEFMGMKRFDKWPDEVQVISENGTLSGFSHQLKDLKYHSSWDWLMPVWKKFGDLLYKNAPRNNQELYLQAQNITVNIVDGLREADIEKTFNWIVRGIDYLNTLSPEDKTTLNK